MWLIGCGNSRARSLLDHGTGDAVDSSSMLNGPATLNPFALASQALQQSGNPTALPRAAGSFSRSSFGSSERGQGKSLFRKDQVMLLCLRDERETRFGLWIEC